MPGRHIRIQTYDVARSRGRGHGGGWTAHIETLKSDPEPGLAVIEPVRSDPSRYVQRAVANWLNDASKSRPDWTQAVCTRWIEESLNKETVWTVHHALRTLRKKGVVG